MTVLFAVNSFAQEFDDVYFDPTVDEISTEEPAAVSSVDDVDEGYEDDYVTEDVDNYDYQYASRIRRFNRSYTGFNYYSGCYVDRYYYDPYSPGQSIYVINNRNRFYGGNRFNNFNSPYGYNPYNPYGYNSFYDPYNSYNPYGYNPYGNNYYNNYNNFGSNYYLANSNPNGSQYYYGPRRSSASNATQGRVTGARKKRGDRGTVTGGNVVKDRVGRDGVSVERKGKDSRVSRNAASGNSKVDRSSRNSGSSASPSRSSKSRASSPSKSRSRASSPSKSRSRASSPSKSRSRASSPSKSRSRASSPSKSRSSSPSRSSKSSSRSSSKSKSSGSRSSSRKGKN